MVVALVLVVVFALTTIVIDSPESVTVHQSVVPVIVNGTMTLAGTVSLINAAVKV